MVSDRNREGTIKLLVNNNIENNIKNLVRVIHRVIIIHLSKHYRVSTKNWLEKSKNY